MPIHYTKNKHIGVFTIDNGDLSVLTPLMHKALYSLLVEFLADPEVHVGILKGCDGASFCAGGGRSHHHAGTRDLFRDQP